MNIRRLRAVQKRILKEPKQFFMNRWFTDSLDWEIPNCGTAACIAGHALVIKDKSNPKRTKEKYRGCPNIEARSYLDLTSGQSDSLFGLDNWPDKFHLVFAKATTPLAKAKIASKRIDFFIETKGTDIA